MRKYGESKTTRIMMATVPHVISGLGHRKFQANGFLLTRVYMDNFFSSLHLFDDLAQKKISCETVRLHRKGMPKDLRPKTLRLKRGDIRVRTRGDLIAMVKRDR